MIAGVEVMGRPKKAKPGKNVPPEERVAIIHLKGSRAYADWLEEAHRETHIAKATIVRVAIAEWAKRNGRRMPPEL